MINREDLEAIERAASIAAAREATLVLLFRGIANPERRAQLRARVQAMGTNRQLVTLAWEQMLNHQGLKLPGAVKAKRGMAWGR